MSIFNFLVTLTAFIVLLGDVAATVVITAPSKVIDMTGELETREQGPTAWICSAMGVESPWTAYANIRGYLEGGNAEGKNYTNLVLYPVMELFHTTQDQSQLCVYLPAEDHCYPPAPSTGAVKAVKQLTKRTYFAIRFWGQAGNARVQYYKQKLTTALSIYNKIAKLDLFFVSFFSNHVREVRYDPATIGIRASNDLAPKRVPSVPNPTGVPGVATAIAATTIAATTIAGALTSATTGKADKTPKVQCRQPVARETLQAGNNKYIKTRVHPLRLSLFDVLKETQTRIRNLDGCKELASRKEYDGFSYPNTGPCTLYRFNKDFCPCDGTLEIYVNRKQMEQSTGHWQSHPHQNLALEEIIIYTGIPVERFQYQMIDQSLDTATENCEKALLSTTVKKPSLSAIFNGNRCSLSLFHDATNCNKPCFGNYKTGLVRKTNPNAIVYFLSHCGETLQITATSEAGSSIYLSHPGTGCYLYPKPTILEEEDCLITFEKAPTAQKLEVVFDYVNLDQLAKGCRDQLIMYDGRKTDKAFLLKSLCEGDKEMRVAAKDSVTINFRRSVNYKETENIGFRLSIFNVQEM